MPILHVNGISLYYESHGAGLPIVFLHGFAGTTQMWKPQIEQFSQRHQFVIYDARGHGRSESPPQASSYSADIAADDLFHLMQALNIRQAVIGGLSMGGYVALRFALRYPDAVSALVLMATGPGFRNPARRAEWNAGLEEIAASFERKGMRPFADSPGNRALVPYSSQDLLLKQNPIGLAHSARKVSGQYDALVIDGLPTIKAPTLILAGAKDPAFLQAAEYMASLILGARKVVIPNAGHAMNIDNAPLFNREVSSFLDALQSK